MVRLLRRRHRTEVDESQGGDGRAGAGRTPRQRRGELPVHFTGSTGTLAYHYSCTRPAVLVFPREGEPVAVAGEMLTHSLAMTTPLRDTRGYVAIERFPYSMVVDALGDVVGPTARIGAELGHEQRMGMPVGDYLGIVRALPEATFEDAGDLIVRLRMVKTPEEVVYMREAAAVTGRARQRLFREVVPGMTERDAVRRLRQLILEEGGESHLLRPPDRGRSRVPQPAPPRSAAREGQRPVRRCRRLRALPHHRLRADRDTGAGERRGEAQPRGAAGGQRTHDRGPAPGGAVLGGAPHRSRGHHRGGLPPRAHGAHGPRPGDSA